MLPYSASVERLEEREAGRHHQVVETQLSSALSSHAPDVVASVVIAYEPVWAIGTGKTATPDDAEAMHRHIREWIASATDAPTAELVRIQYGGSVKPENASSLLARPRHRRRPGGGSKSGSASISLELRQELRHPEG